MFEIAFKIGSDAHIFSRYRDTIQNIDQWIARVMAIHSWSGWYMYNDDPPIEPTHRYQAQGHCKGIIMWNNTYTAWLIHSVPQWPRHIPTEQLPEEVRDECHTFCFWCGSTDVLYKIEKQVDLMQARIYAGKRSQLYQPSSLAVLQRIKLDEYTDHVAKNTHWERDLYQSLGRCRVKSRASMENTSVVTNVQTLNIPGWTAASDFGRWAVGDRWVCVGDVRRGPSEFPFGGGCIIRYDDILVSKLRRLIVD